MLAPVECLIKFMLRAAVLKNDPDMIQPGKGHQLHKTEEMAESIRKVSLKCTLKKKTAISTDAAAPVSS